MAVRAKAERISPASEPVFSLGEARPLTRDDARDLLRSMTPRQRQIAAAYAALAASTYGSSGQDGEKAVARLLGLTRCNVNKQVQQIGRRVNVHGRLALAMLVWKAGLEGADPTREIDL